MTLEAYFGVEEGLDSYWTYDIVRVSLCFYHADPVPCRIRRQLAVLLCLSHFHRDVYFPIRRDPDFFLWTAMVPHDETPQTSHIGYERPQAMVPRSQSVPHCFASWWWLEFFF
jgi:hypothetical protein